MILLSSTRLRSEIASVGAFVLPYVQLGQIAIVLDRGRHPGAYVTWGNLTDDALHELSRDPSAIPDIEQLNAGDNLVIFDVLSNLPSLRPIFQTIADLVRRTQKPFHAVREVRTGGRLAVRRYHASSFLRKVQTE